MRQRDYRDWQKRQLRGDVRPWSPSGDMRPHSGISPAWVRVLVWIGLAVALAAIVVQIWG